MGARSADHHGFLPICATKLSHFPDRAARQCYGKPIRSEDHCTFLMASNGFLLSIHIARPSHVSRLAASSYYSSLVIYLPVWLLVFPLLRCQLVLVIEFNMHD